MKNKYDTKRMQQPMNFMEDFKMKETAIQKINKMGKVGSIIITIAKIFCIIGFVFILAGTIAVGRIPQDFILFSAGGSGTMEIHMDAVNSSLTDEDRAQFNDENLLKSGYLETDDGNFRLIKFLQKVIPLLFLQVKILKIKLAYMIRCMFWLR